MCNACLGQTSPHTSGRRRSVLLLALSVLLALTFQYSLAPAILGDKSSWWNVFRKAGVGKHVFASWTDGCDAYLEEEGRGGDGDVSAGPYAQCAGNAGVYRPTFISFLFFAIASAASYARPSTNREVWPAKYCLYLLFVLASVFVSNHPWFLGVFLHVSRVGAMVFIVVQQIILIDLAYNWNDNWVGESPLCNIFCSVVFRSTSLILCLHICLRGGNKGKADSADRVEWGSGAKWLRLTIGMCALFYMMAFTGIGLLYHYYSGCSSNTAIITMTLLGILAVTAVQLSGVEGSLLTSSVISFYVVYLGYSAVSKNPHGECNPSLAKDNDPLNIVVGLVLTALSLAWTGWSWTAEDRLSADGVKKARSLGRSGNAFRRGQDPLLDLDDPFLEYNDEDRPPSGLALSSEDGEDYLSMHSSDIWKLNAILALVSCWVAMSLTGFGSISGGIVEEGGAEIHTAANPQVGKVNMAMIAVSQWVALLLYAWTLVAPRLFPDRDFS